MSIIYCVKKPIPIPNRNNKFYSILFYAYKLYILKRILNCFINRSKHLQFIFNKSLSKKNFIVLISQYFNQRQACNKLLHRKSVKDISYLLLKQNNKFSQTGFNSKRIKIAEEILIGLFKGFCYYKKISQ